MFPGKLFSYFNQVVLVLGVQHDTVSLVTEVHVQDQGWDVGLLLLLGLLVVTAGVGVACLAGF